MDDELHTVLNLFPRGCSRQRQCLQWSHRRSLKRLSPGGKMTEVSMSIGKSRASSVARAPLAAQKSFDEIDRVAGHPQILFRADRVAA
jgi:hypothetical protein